MKVKICGITTTDMAKTVAQAGADFVGFVFAPSKRQITAEAASKITAQLPNDIKKIGVFVNETKENICQIAETVGLDYIQLHGDEPASFADSLPYPVIKAFSIDDVTDDILQTYPCDYLLIDSPPSTYRGGSGTTFNWETLKKHHIPMEKLILAGGLSIDNVRDAKTNVNPAGVDVSSGVETTGVKDPEKIRQFISLAKKDG